MDPNVLPTAAFYSLFGETACDVKVEQPRRSASGAADRSPQVPTITTAPREPDRLTDPLVGGYAAGTTLLFALLSKDTGLMRFYPFNRAFKEEVVYCCVDFVFMDVRLSYPSFLVCCFFPVWLHSAAGVIRPRGLDG